LVVSTEVPVNSSDQTSVQLGIEAHCAQLVPGMAASMPRARTRSVAIAMAPWLLVSGENVVFLMINFSIAQVVMVRSTTSSGLH
jgi:hypothetical protein